MIETLIFFPENRIPGGERRLLIAVLRIQIHRGLPGLDGFSDGGLRLFPDDLLALLLFFQLIGSAVEGELRILRCLLHLGVEAGQAVYGCLQRGDIVGRGRRKLIGKALDEHQRPFICLLILLKTLDLPRGRILITDVRRLDCILAAAPLLDQQPVLRHLGGHDRFHLLHGVIGGLDGIDRGACEKFILKIKDPTGVDHPRDQTDQNQGDSHGRLPPAFFLFWRFCKYFSHVFFPFIPFYYHVFYHTIFRVSEKALSLIFR